MRRARPAIYGIFWIFILTFVFGGLALFFGFFEAVLFQKKPHRGDQLRLSRQMRRLWARGFLWVHGIEVQLQGPGVDLLRQTKASILVANHQSALDIFVMAASLPLNLVFFSKKELLYVPILGWAAWFGGSIYIDRKKGVRDRRAIESIQTALQKENMILIFPEGTRSPDGALKPFKRGAFVLAIETQAALFPVSITKTHQLMPKGSFRVSPGKVDVFIESPVSTENKTLEDRHELSGLARQRILDRQHKN